MDHRQERNVAFLDGNTTKSGEPRKMHLVKRRVITAMREFGVLRNLDDLRQIWPHEAGDFTPWLADNIERLGEAIGLDLELTRIEADAGDFCCDLLAKDLGTGRNVIVENQLTATDHDHLGKLITYASAFDPVAII